MPIAESNQRLLSGSTGDTSAVLKQCWVKWRIRRLGGALLRTDLLAASLDSKAVPDDALMEKMQESMQKLCNIRSAALFVGCVFAARGREGMKTPAVGRKLLAGVFLNRFSELHGNNPALSSACHLLVSATTALIFSASLENQTAFAQAWACFDSTFTAWHQRDKAEFIESINTEQQALENLRSAIPPESQSEWEPHIADYGACLDSAMRRLSTDSISKQVEKALECDPAETVLDTAENPALHADIRPLAVGNGMLSNMQMMHDLVIDPTYSFLKLANVEPLKVSINDMTQEQVAQLILRLRDEVMSMLDKKRHAKTIADINQALDPEHILQEASHGALDARGLLRFMASVLAQMCAPVRDEMAATLVEMSSDAPMDDLVRKTTDLLIMMHEDHGNYLLKIIKPVVVKTIVDTERAWFESNVIPGATKARTMVSTICESMVKIHGPDTTSSLPDLLARVVSECIAQTACTAAMNELLAALDGRRLEAIGNDMKHIGTLSALLVLSRGAKCLIEGDSETARRLYALVSQNAEAASISAELPGVSPLAIAAVLSGTNPVATVMARRLRQLLAAAMRRDGKRYRDIRALEKHGVPTVCSADWLKACETAERVHVMHTKIHGPTYEAWISDAIAACPCSDRAEYFAPNCSD